MRQRFAVTLTALITCLACGCGRSRDQTVCVVGSTSIHPFAEVLAQEFNAQNPGLCVEVQGGGSTLGLLAVESHVADIGACSRHLRPEESGFTAIPIAQDGVAIVVHPSNPLAGVSREELRRLFSGAIANWRELGGKDAPVRLVTREEGSGTREAFASVVMGEARISAGALTQESNGAVKEVVRQDPCAIGFMSLSLVGQGLKALAVDGVAPSMASVASGSYPIARPFLLVVKGEPTTAALRFIIFVASPAAQELLEEERAHYAAPLAQRPPLSPPRHAAL